MDGDNEKEIGAPAALAHPRPHIADGWRLTRTAANLWRNYYMLPPTSHAARRWLSSLRILFFVNLFMLPIDLCFYHLKVGWHCGSAVQCRGRAVPR